MPKVEMTVRILRALDDPCVTFLGHMTGRRLLAREGYTFDYERIFERAAERGVMIEINGNPNRLDIDWRVLPRAPHPRGCFSIPPHAPPPPPDGAALPGDLVAPQGGPLA